MSENLNRRSFIGAAAGAAASAAAFLYPGVGGATRMDAASTKMITGELDPNFAGGQVISILPNGVLLQSDALVRAVRINPNSTVWKEYDTSPTFIELGDWVDARGTALSDGSLQARDSWVWVNIGRKDGVISALQSGGMVLAQDSGRSAKVDYSSRLEVISGHDDSPLPGHVKGLAVGMSVGTVGLRLPDGGYRATRIWTWGKP